MTAGELGGWIGGIIGGLVGLAGGVVGTYYSIKNTGGPRERAFMVKAAAMFWGVSLAFFALFFLLPNPYQWLLWVPYSILLPLGIVFGNRRQQAIRQAESRDNPPLPTLSQPPGQ